MGVVLHERERRASEKVIEKKRGARRPLEYDSPKVDEVLTSSLLPSSLVSSLLPFSLRPSSSPAFHAVRDLTVAPTWQNTPDFSGQSFFGFGLRRGVKRRRPSTLTGASRLFFQFVAIIVLTCR
jgi:hypothetical protein